jgi:hypothetical protein
MERWDERVKNKVLEEWENRWEAHNRRVGRMLNSRNGKTSRASINRQAMESFRTVRDMDGTVERSRQTRRTKTRGKAAETNAFAALTRDSDSSLLKITE